MDVEPEISTCLRYSLEIVKSGNDEENSKEELRCCATEKIANNFRLCVRSQVVSTRVILFVSVSSLRVYVLGRRAAL